MRYLFHVLGELAIEAENIQQAKQKFKDGNYDDMTLFPISSPIPEELLYSLENDN